MLTLTRGRLASIVRQEAIAAYHSRALSGVLEPCVDDASRSRCPIVRKLPSQATSSSRHQNSSCVSALHRRTYGQHSLAQAFGGEQCSEHGERYDEVCGLCGFWLRGLLAWSTLPRKLSQPAVHTTLACLPETLACCETFCLVLGGPGLFCGDDTAHQLSCSPNLSVRAAEPATQWHDGCMGRKHTPAFECSTRRTRTPRSLGSSRRAGRSWRRAWAQCAPLATMRRTGCTCSVHRALVV
jgi:hypothetical protein